MPDRQTTEYSATQLVYSIKFKLSHAIWAKFKFLFLKVPRGGGSAGLGITPKKKRFFFSASLIIVVIITSDIVVTDQLSAKQVVMTCG